MEEVKEKFKEAVSSILPIAIIMFIIGIILGFNIVTMVSLIISTFLLIIGVTMFTYGADLSMIEIGKIVSSNLIRTKKPIIIAFISFIVGVIITVAEPDLKVLATQMTAIDSKAFIMCVGVGVGLFLALAAIRILFQLSLKAILTIFYGILLIFLCISASEMIPVAFDSGGVTTGPMSVPFILAMGLGFSASRAKHKSKEDSFGLVALCSIGPVLVVLIFGLLMNQDMNYTYNISKEITSFSILALNYANHILPTLKEVIMSLLPILALFIIFAFLSKKVKKKKVMQILTGLVITLLGLVLFFVGVNVGYMPIAYLLGIKMVTSYKVFLVPLGIIIGFVIVKAEPAVSVLTEQIEKMTEGSIKRSVITTTIAIGVGAAVAISITRILTGISIFWFLFIGYLIAILLMIKCPKLFTMVAFDSGGAVSGPMTSSFLLPLMIGICYQVGGNVLTDAFGLVALVALSPLLTIQILGIIYNIKSKKQINVEDLDEAIIEYKWGN